MASAKAPGPAIISTIGKPAKRNEPRRSTNIRREARVSSRVWRIRWKTYAAGDQRSDALQVRQRHRHRSFFAQVNERKIERRRQTQWTALVPESLRSGCERGEERRQNAACSEDEHAQRLAPGY